MKLIDLTRKCLIITDLFFIRVNFIFKILFQVM